MRFDNFFDWILKQGKDIRSKKFDISYFANGWHSF